MKKVLSFCVLCVFLVMMCVGVKAQTPGCCMSITPGNLPSPMVANQPDTFYIQPDLSCLTGDTKISIEWVVKRNGVQIPDGMLSTYLNDFRFQTLGRVNGVEAWIGESYTSAYCNNGNGYGSYPGANTPIIDEGIPCAFEGPFAIEAPGQHTYYDYFYVRFFADTNITGHRLIINPKDDAEYEITLSIYTRTGGTDWDYSVENAEHQNTYIGGHMSQLGSLVMTEILDQTEYIQGPDQVICYGDTLWLGNPLTPFYTTGNDTAYYYSVAYTSGLSCHADLDSVVTFRLDVINLDAPELNVAASDLQICDGGAVTLTAIPSVAIDPTTCVWFDAANTPLDTTDVYNTNVTATTTFNVYSYESTHNCLSATFTPVVVEVYASPAPFVTDASIDTVCEKQEIKLYLDQDYSAASVQWYHNGTAMTGETKDSLIISDAQLADAGEYKAEVSVVHTHSVYTTLTITCTGEATDSVIVNARPEAAIVDFNGEAMNVVDTTLADFVCPVGEDSITVAVTGGVAPYVYTWTNADAQVDAAAASTGVVINGICDTTYSLTMTATDANGCVVKQDAKITYTVNDTVAPEITVNVPEVPADTTGADCKFIVPDVLAGITATDNCSINSLTQTPAAGDTILATTTVYVTAIDSCGNTTIDSVIVKVSPMVLAVPADSILDVLCPNIDPNTGSFVINITDGTPNFNLMLVDVVSGTILGTPIADVESTYKFENLVASDYRVYVVDANGCEDSIDVTINAPAPLAFKATTPSTVDASCSSTADGQIIVGVEGGVTPYTMIVTSTGYADTIVANAIDTILAGLEAGEYVIDVVDSNECLLTDTVTINQPVVLTVDTLVANNPICHDDTTGNAMIVVSGGTAPYTYAWTKDSLAGDTVSIADKTDTILTPGTYFVRVVDVNGCDLVRSFTLTNPDAMSFYNVTPTTLTCPYEAEYEFMVVMDQMQPEVTYTWIIGTDTVRDVTSTLNNDTLHYTPLAVSCDTTLTLHLMVSDSNSCHIDTLVEFSIVDTIAPAHTGTLDTIEILACSVTDAPAELATLADFAAVNVELTDNCTAPADLIITCTADSMTTACPFIIKRTYKVADKCGNIDSLVQIVSISDTVKPMVVYGTDTISDGGTVGDSIVYADHNCNPNLPLSRDYTVAEVIANNVGGISKFISCTVNDGTAVRYDVTTTVIDATDTVRGIVYGATLTVTDLCGNVSVFNAPVVVKDTIKPDVTDLEDSVYYVYATATGCNDNVPAAFTTVGQVNAHTPNAIFDCNVNANTPVVLTNADSTFNCPDSIVRTYTVTDAAGNSATFTHTIIILDTVAPILSMDTIADTLYETASCAADAAQLAALEGNFSDVAAITAAYPDFTAGDCTDLTVNKVGTVDSVIARVPALTMTYTYEITDECGNSTEFKHVVRVFDTIAPVVEDAIPFPVDTVYSTSTDCSPAIAPISDLAAMDAYFTSKGNTLTITECHLDSTTLNYVRTDTNATNACDLIYDFVYTVADSAANVSEEFKLTVHVLDTVAPVLAGVLPDSTIYLTADCNYDVIPATTVAELDSIFGAAFVSAECNLDSVVVSSIDTIPGDGSLQQVSIFNVTYTIADSCGNDTTAIQVIFLLDTVKPVLMTAGAEIDTIPTDTVYTDILTCAYDPALLATVADLPTGYTIKDCSVLPTTPITLDHADTTGTCPEVVTRTYTVTDTCTNTSLPFTHTIVFMDTVAPIVAAADYLDTLVAYTNGATGCDFDAPTAYADLAAMVAVNANFNDPADCHDVTMTAYEDHDTVYTGCAEHYFTRTYTLKDECGNATTVDQIITVSDTNAPVAGTGLITDTIATPRYNNCIFVVPNLEDTMKPLYTDNCMANADLIFVQVPAAGDTITTDTVVKVWVIDACINGTDTLYKNVSDTALVNVTIPAMPVVDTIMMDSVLCAGDNTGAFQVVMVGEAPYSMSYEYNPNPNGRSNGTVNSTNDTLAVDSLYAGRIEFTVADVYGCTVDSFVEVKEPDTLKNLLTFLATADCSANDMIIRDTLLGGVAPFTYEWTVSEGATEVFASPVVGPTTHPDTLVYAAPSDNNEHTFTYSVLAKDSKGCPVSNDTVYVTYPTYHFSDSDRICMSNLPYTWTTIVPARVITIADIPTDNTNYVFTESDTSVHGCDSIHTLYLEVTSNPYLVGRVASDTAAIDGSDLVETIVEYTTSTDTTSQFDFFVRKNCADCGIKISLEVDMYVVDENGNETLMTNVTNYAQVSFATYLDMNFTQWTPSNSASISLPGHYVSFNGISQRLNYYNLCYADPDYPCNPTPTAASQTALPFYGPNYDGAGAPNIGRVNGIKVASWRRAGTYKFVVRLARRDDATAYALTARDWCSAIQVGGHSAALTSTIYDTLTFLVHVAAGTSPIPAIDPFESEVNFSDPASVEEADVAVYPNPARDQVNVELTGFEGQTVIIVANSEGRVMNNISLDVDALSSNVLSINTADFAQGVYTITARCSNAIVTKRVVIIR